MANITNEKGVLILDTAADSIVPAGTPVRISKIRYKGNASGNAATLTDAGGTVAKWQEIATAAQTLDTNFHRKPLVLDGLRLLTITAGTLVYVYTDN